MATKTRARLTPAPGLLFVREALVPLDWLALRTSAVYYGFGIPHGDGAPVVLVPGFLGTDRYLMEMFHWLKRVGYQPFYSGLGRNADCLDVMVNQLIKTIRRARKEAKRPVRLIGHSLGGTIARAAAVKHPELVSQIITLGSPIQSARVHPAVLAAAELVRGRIRKKRPKAPEGCYTDECNCDVVESVGEEPPPSVARASIYTKSDGVIDWHCCMDDDDEMNYRVGGTHCGLAFNPKVFKTVARLLASVKA
jgi:triacylglycerol lipase